MYAFFVPSPFHVNSKESRKMYLKVIHNKATLYFFLQHLRVGKGQLHMKRLIILTKEMSEVLMKLNSKWLDKKKFYRRYQQVLYSEINSKLTHKLIQTEIDD